jgi:hypothetical protein
MNGKRLRKALAEAQRIGQNEGKWVKAKGERSEEEADA